MRMIEESHIQFEFLIECADGDWSWIHQGLQSYMWRHRSVLAGPVEKFSIAESDDGMNNVHKNRICDEKFSAVKINFVSAIAKVVSRKSETEFTSPVVKVTVRIRLIFSDKYVCVVNRNSVNDDIFVNGEHNLLGFAGQKWFGKLTSLSQMQLSIPVFARIVAIEIAKRIQRSVIDSLAFAVIFARA